MMQYCGVGGIQHAAGAISPDWQAVSQAVSLLDQSVTITLVELWTYPSDNSAERQALHLDNGQCLPAQTGCMR